MTKIALITDTHFGVRNDNQILAAYFTKFYRDIFFPRLEAENIKRIIHLGDVVDRRKFINFLSSDQLRSSFMNPINDLNIHLDCIVGNHDIYFKNKLDINAINQLYCRSDYPINLIEKPTEIDIDGCKILLVPWICADNSNSCYEALSTSTASIVMGHFEINGFEMHRGSICEAGIGKDIFNRFDLALSGHFHHKSSYGNIHYLGCPYEMTWNDYDDPKGFHIFDTETFELTFIENPYKIFVKFEYDETKLSMDELEQLDCSVFEGTYMKVICKRRDDNLKFSTFLEKLTKAGVYNLQVVEDLLNLDMESDDELITQAKSTLELLETAVTQLDTKVDKKKLNNLFRELYQGALDIE